MKCLESIEDLRKLKGGVNVILQDENGNTQRFVYDGIVYEDALTYSHRFIRFTDEEHIEILKLRHGQIDFQGEVLYYDLSNCKNSNFESVSVWCPEDANLWEHCSKTIQSSQSFSMKWLEMKISKMRGRF